MSQLKPFILYTLGPAPNPWKVAMILEELGLPYTTKDLGFDELKTEPFISVNPNGRVPALVDPNNEDIALWESGAIIDYLIDVYDKEARFTYKEFPQKYTIRSWLFFQVTGQGPYFGQSSWFNHLHHEKIPSAIERYEKEVIRVIGVIDAHLEKQGTEYLVGDKITYPDIMFYPYFIFLGRVAPGVKDTSSWKNYTAWMARIGERPTIQRVMEKMDAEKKKHSA
ncbi:glutathione-s-transferase theta gst [Paramyrothecium foliicola]|nr:glutathione-s-transferase theta gst [Paramyrothecium foliicola]